MIPDQVKSEAKRASLITVLSEALVSRGASGSASDVACSAEQIFDSVIEVTAPDLSGLDSASLVLMKPGGREATSVKAGNLTLDFRKLANLGASGVLTVAGLAHPWLLFAAGVVLWNQIYTQLEVPISEPVAAVLWAMWLRRDPKTNRISSTELLSTVNEGLAAHGRPPITALEFEQSLRTLQDLRCIEPDGDRWWLRESIRVSF